MRNMNRLKRKEALLKITVENQLILRRLQDKKSEYRVDEWENDFKRREKILKKMCEYPYTLGDRNRGSVT
jgi:hypothetical protein